MSDDSKIERPVGIEIAVRGLRRGPPRARMSHFTGKTETYAELEMTGDEYRAATDVLDRYGKLDEHGEGRLELPTAQIEVWGFDVDGGMLNLVGELPGACEFVFELATAANLVIQFESALAEAGAAVTTAAALALARTLDEAAQEELGPIVLVADAAALWRALAPPHAQPRAVS